MSYESDAQERDENLHRKIAMHLDELGQAYHGWAQEEVRDAITELKFQLPLEHPEPLRLELTDALARAKQLNETELDRLRNQMRDRLHPVLDGDFQSFRDARENLDEVIARYDAISVELLRIRSIAVALAIATEPEP
jgi:hypothetical protein